MNRTAFDDIAELGELAYVTADNLDGPQGRVRRRRAARTAGVGGVTLLACGAVATGVLANKATVAPAASPTSVLDPSSIATVAGANGTNLVGDCPGDDGSPDRPGFEAKYGTYSILVGVADCAIRSVSGADIIDASTSLHKTTAGTGNTTWLRTTVTNVSDRTIAFDLASPTLEVIVPEDSHWFHQVMTAARPLQSDETWSESTGIESWGGSGAPRGGIGQVVTPRLDGPARPGVAWNLVLQRPQDDGLNVATSRGTVTLSPGQSFIFESGLDVQAIAASDDKEAQRMVDLFTSPDDLTAHVYVSLQPDALGDGPRTLLVDSTVPLTWED